jgi:SPP1 family predicted phage head-tail adaptor
MLTRLPHWIVIQAESRTTFEGGAFTTSWTTQTSDWANVQPSKANETYQNDKKQQMTIFNVTMRYLATVSNKNRLIFENQTYVIESVYDPTNRQRMMVLTCRLELT